MKRKPEEWEMEAGEKKSQGFIEKEVLNNHSDQWFRNTLALTTFIFNPLWVIVY